MDGVVDQMIELYRKVERDEQELRREVNDQRMIVRSMEARLRDKESEKKALYNALDALGKKVPEKDPNGNA